MFKRLQKLLRRADPTPRPPEDDQSVLVNAYCTRASIPPFDFAHELHSERDLSDPELAAHLDGFVGYVAQCGDGEMTRSRYHVIRHIQRVRRQVSLSLARQRFDSLAKWAAEANAILFMPDGSVLDPQGRTLVSPSAAHPALPDAEVPYPDEAWQRKLRTETALSGKGIAVSPSLPPVASEPELQRRSPAEVAGRALALWIVALRAESLAAGGPIPISELQQRFPTGFDYLTPDETDFLGQSAPSNEVVVAMAWRYEALLVLVWALGLVESLSFPSAICDVAALAHTLVRLDGAALLRSTTQRPDGDVLDAIDLHYRLHWLVRQARLGGQPSPHGLDGGVIQERHHALNWLVRFEGKEWDDVDTPT